MLRKFLSVAAAALLISVILLTPASSADTGEAFILYGAHRSWTVEMDQWFVLSYDIASTDGSIINILVIPAADYPDYLDGSGTTDTNWTETGAVTNASMDLQLRPGAYYVVVEAAAKGNGNGTPINYRIDMRPLESPTSSLPVVLGAGAVILLGVVICSVVEARNRRVK